MVTAACSELAPVVGEAKARALRLNITGGAVVARAAHILCGGVTGSTSGVVKRSPLAEFSRRAESRAGIRTVAAGRPASSTSGFRWLANGPAVAADAISTVPAPV
jgi:hypothetical protein